MSSAPLLECSDNTSMARSGSRWILWWRVLLTSIIAGAVRTDGILKTESSNGIVDDCRLDSDEQQSPVADRKSKGTICGLTLDSNEQVGLPIYFASIQEVLLMGSATELVSVFCYNFVTCNKLYTDGEYY